MKECLFLNVRKPENPRCLKGKVLTLTFLLLHVRRACVNFSIFDKWLKEFDNYISRTSVRRVALLIDNASAHAKLDDLPVLLIFEVIYLPKSTTSYVQPLHDGTIASLKEGYRKKQYQQALSSLES